jgi:hypothetical protein
LLLTNEFGCSSQSEELLVVICEDDYSPDIDVSFDTLSYIQSSIYEYQWLYEGVEIMGANSYMLIAQDEGNYSLLLTDQWGCKFVSEDVFFSTASLYDYASNKLSVFPNPANDYIDIVIDSKHSFTFLELYDMQGRKVFSQELWGVKHRLDLRALTRGGYILKLHSNGQQLAKRIVLN